MMTLRDRQFAMLVDLMLEQEEFPEWKAYYDRKIAALDEVLYGSGSGPEAGGSTELPDVSSRPSQVVREGGDANSTMSV